MAPLILLLGMLLLLKVVVVVRLLSAGDLDLDVALGLDRAPNNDPDDRALLPAEALRGPLLLLLLLFAVVMFAPRLLPLRRAIDDSLL